MLEREQSFSVNRLLRNFSIVFKKQLHFEPKEKVEKDLLVDSSNLSQIFFYEFFEKRKENMKVEVTSFDLTIS
jgi:hypothetical protein